MPSHLHEALLELFRNRPTLAPKLLRDVLGAKLPAYTGARAESADLSVLKPPEFRADLVVALTLRHDKVVEGIVVEAQLKKAARKRFVWPSYATVLRARLEVPVTVLVVTVNEAVARWASRPIPIGGGNTFTPLVMRLSSVPVVTDERQAVADLELAVLSTMAHGRDRDVRKAARIARAAWEAAEAMFALDPKRAEMYFDILQASVSEGVRRELRKMDPAKYEYQSRFAKRHLAQGRAEGRAELIVRQLTRRFGPPDAATLERIAAASIEELDAIGERLLTAPSLEDALRSR